VLESVHTAVLRAHNPDDMAVAIARAGEDAEREERWSCVGKKGNPRWVWHASDHPTGAV
jgi:insertion element IS1 protein InsB